MQTIIIQLLDGVLWFRTDFYSESRMHIIQLHLADRNSEILGLWPSHSAHFLLSLSLSFLLPLVASSVFTGLPSVCLVLFWVSSRYCCTALRTAFSTSLLLRLTNSASSGSAPFFSPMYHNRQKKWLLWKESRCTRYCDIMPETSIFALSVGFESVLFFLWK